MPDDLKLVKPSMAWVAAFVRMDNDRRALEGDSANGYGFGRWPDPDDLESYVQHLHNMEAGIGLEDWMVPQSVFWMVFDDCEVVGDIRIRHRLTPALEQHGGNIGYYVAAAHRGKGYGKTILQLALDECKKLGLRRVLITCRPDNIASASVIRANGGVQTTDGVNAEDGSPVSRYWIDIC